MVIPTKKMSKRTLAPVDQWLADEGYFRKLTPRDPNCLFRAFSEQVYHTQHFHLRVREECIDFIRKHKDLFKDYVTTPFDYYLKEMQGYTSWGGLTEIRAMSMYYKRDVVIFVGEKQICDNFTNYNFKNGLILLCHTEPKQYEPVYPMAFVQSAAYCQSIVYEVVYKYMYKMPNIKTVADKMLHNRNTPAIRHDRFFQKGNLDIREQLIEDLYKKVNERDNRSDHDVRIHHGSDEVQSDWKGGTSPIPYKVAKALAPDYYRNIELDIWHELKREVKSAGWNRYNSNELQVGGKCLIEININDLEQCDRNNNKKLLANSSGCGISESDIENSKGEPEKLKQGSMGLQGYIQEMPTKKEPVLVFIKDLGEKKFVPYDALKPLPVVKKNKPRNWVAVNRNHTVNSDSSRRWKKSYNSFSRKKKDTINVVHETSNTNKNILTNNNDNNNTVDSNNINDINRSRTDEQNNELSTIDKCQTENQSVEGCNRATNEETNLSAVVAHSQSTLSNSASHKVEEEPKKAIFRKINTIPRNKTERSNNPRNGLQNSCSKLKALDENYSLPCNSNQQINMSGNPNVSYIVADNGSTYPVYSYVQPGNYGEHNQVDHTFANNFFYNLHLLHLEDNFRTVNPPYYGPMMYGSSHHGVQPSGNAHAMNNVPCTQDEMEHFVNGMQNCSLTYSEGTGVSDETSNTLYWSMNSAHNTGQPKQGSRNLNGKDSSYQIMHKGKQTGTAKGTGNRARNRQQNRGSMYSTQQQHSGQHYGGTSMHTYDTRRNDPHVVQQSRSWDPMLHQIAPNTTSNAYASPQYAPPPGVFSPPMPYHELSSHYPTNDGILGNPSPYYPPGNGSYVPVPPYLPPQHVDAAENATVSSYPQHLYSPTESLYPQSHPQTAGQPMLYSQPMMYPQPMQYHALLPQHVQEQWNPMLGQQPYVQCTASAPIPPQAQIAEPSSNGQCTTTPKGSH